MKKLLLFMTAVVLLPMVLGAQELAPNQKLLGHYTTDQLATTGWGKSFLKGVNPVATDITPDELALFQGSKIVAFRIGLAEQAPVTRVFVMPVDPNGNLGEVTEWNCNVSSQGWNVVELETPYMINLPDDYSLRIGFDYEQATNSSKPISAVNVGTIYPSFIYRNGNWFNYGIDVTGNLSLQCIAENDNFPSYIIRLMELTAPKYIKVGDEFPISFMICNLGVGTVAAGSCVMNVAIDGNPVGTITNSKALTGTYTLMQASVASDGLTTGEHTLTLTAISANGEAVAPSCASCTFLAFENGFNRQMRLVEQFTSTGCTHCPKGTANIQALTQMRNDIAWVAIHENMNGDDPFRTEQTDSIKTLEGIDAYPEGSFDRSTGIEYSDLVSCVLSVTPASTMNDFLDYIETFAWAQVNINSTFDNASRKAVITVSGDMTPDFESRMGGDSRLTVYITEDSLVAPQLNAGVMIDDYVHNGVLRKALGSVKGVAIKRTGDSYKNEFTITIPNDWNANNLNIVAFISRPLGNTLDDIYVNNANTRKLGESDEPEYVRGDVDGSGKVTIDDATMLIDGLLTSSELNTTTADCDMNGKITIDDVTLLIDYLLSGIWAE